MAGRGASESVGHRTRVFALLNHPGQDPRLDLSYNEKLPGCGADAVKPRYGLSHELYWRETRDQISQEKTGCGSLRQEGILGATVATLQEGNSGWDPGVTWHVTPPSIPTCRQIGRSLSN